MFNNKGFVVVADEGDIVVIEPIGDSTAESQENKISIDQDVADPVPESENKISIDQDVADPAPESENKISIDQDVSDPVPESQNKISIDQDVSDPVPESEENQDEDKENHDDKEIYCKSMIRVGLSRKQKITKRLHQYLFKAKTRESQRSL
ncbi:uncharacterized protein LOC107371505 isoform X1 [Tetranychus urticae]|uniref:uncharacterized protein LOC107371505 isoform X1 n=1 Tax=Tetranychus urticae TaxID=32264 RepID=UPI00077BEA81|nr:uncharacterized protein LOC107371505 isoform X1 [Tetranychus urticae]